jgi:hypothetical protein
MEVAAAAAVVVAAAVGGSSSSAGSGGGGSSSSAGGGGGTNAGGAGKGGQMGHGAKGGEVGPGGRKGVGATHGLGNGLGTALGRAIGLVAKALGLSKGPEMSKGGGNGTTHGRGLGFGHASIGNPGHNALSGRSSHSQNSSHRGGTPDGRSFSNHTHAEHSLAQDHVAHTPKADQAEQVVDQGAGKAKGFVDSISSNQELQADPSGTLNPSPDNDVAIELQPNQELQALISSWAFNSETIPSDPDDTTYALEAVFAGFSKAFRTLENLTDPDTAIKKFNQANALIEGVEDQWVKVPAATKPPIKTLVRELADIVELRIKESASPELTQAMTNFVENLKVFLD